MTPPVPLPFSSDSHSPSALPTPISPSPQGSTPCLLSIKIERVRGEDPAESATSTHAAGSKYHFQLQMSFHRLVLFISFFSPRRWQFFDPWSKLKMIHVFEHVCVYVNDFIKKKNPTKSIWGFACGEFGRTLGSSGVYGHDVSDQMSKYNTSWVTNSQER